MDHDKDGIITKNDLRFTFDQVGRLANEKELDEMIGEASGPINFTQLLNLFATRMSGSGGKMKRNKYLGVHPYEMNPFFHHAHVHKDVLRTPISLQFRVLSLRLLHQFSTF